MPICQPLLIRFNTHLTGCSYFNIPKQAKNVGYVDSRKVKLAACMKKAAEITGWNWGFKAGLPSGIQESRSLNHTANVQADTPWCHEPPATTKCFNWQVLFSNICSFTSRMKTSYHQRQFSLKRIPQGPQRGCQKTVKKRHLRLESRTRAHTIKVRHQRQSELWSLN